MADYEEARDFPRALIWGLIIGSSLAIMGWGVVSWLIIPDPPRQWDLGGLPDVPGQSVYSTVPTPLQFPAAQQMAPLPEARPWDAGSGR